jgi:hypothetical protein
LDSSDIAIPNGTVFFLNKGIVSGDFELCFLERLDNSDIAIPVGTFFFTMALVLCPPERISALGTATALFVAAAWERQGIWAQI